MRKNEKLLQIIREYTLEDWFGKVIFITFMIVILLAELLGINAALNFNNYFIMAAASYFLVFIAMCFTKPMFFAKLNYRLSKWPKLTEFIYKMLAIITICLSWKYFIAFMLTLLNAVMLVDFYKVVEVEE